MCRVGKKTGFTLAEVLIALALLGVVAAFTVPKVLQAVGSQQAKAITTETTGMVAEAYQQYQLNHQGANLELVKWSDLLPYMNHLGAYTGTFDGAACQAMLSCGTASYSCIKLPNGAVLAYNSLASFSYPAKQPGDQVMMFFHIDPDGRYGGNSASQSVALHLYPNGLIRPWGTVLPNSFEYMNTAGWQPLVATPTCDPAWYKN